MEINRIIEILDEAAGMRIESSFERENAQAQLRMNLNERNVSYLSKLWFSEDTFTDAVVYLAKQTDKTQLPFLHYLLLVHHDPRFSLIAEECGKLIENSGTVEEETLKEALTGRGEKELTGSVHQALNLMKGLGVLKETESGLMKNSAADPLIIKMIGMSNDIEKDMRLFPLRQ